MKNDKKQQLSQLGFDATIEYFQNPLRYKKIRLFMMYQNLAKELVTLRDSIKKGKDAELKIALSKALLIAIKNKDALEKVFYNNCINILDEISSNITISQFLKRVKLNNKEKLLIDLEKTIYFANNKQAELKQHLNIISELLL